MAVPKNPMVLALVGWASRLRFPWLFAITATLFILDVLVPDFVPLADEILLGLATLLLGSWKRRRDGKPGASAGDKPAAEKPPVIIDAEVVPPRDDP